MSDLLKVYEIQSEDKLQKRVQGAVINKANAVLEDSSSSEVSKAYAATVLADPFEIRHDMYRHVTANHSILAAVVQSEDGLSWDTDPVTDQDIEYVVATKWDHVAQAHDQGGAQ